MKLSLNKIGITIDSIQPQQHQRHIVETFIEVATFLDRILIGLGVVFTFRGKWSHAVYVYMYHKIPKRSITQNISEYYFLI